MINENEVKKMMTTKDTNLCCKMKTRLCILTSQYYNSSLEYFLFLFELAKKDFPELKFKNIEIRHYTGRFHKGLSGIEFTVKAETMPSEYVECSDSMICSMYPT